MLKQILKLSLCALIAAAPLEAKSRKSSRKKAQTAQTAEKPKESAYDKLFKKKHDVADGMIKLHKVGDKLYFEFPQALFGREMLLGSVISETSDNLTGVPGSKSYVPLHITFTKTGENVQIREINADNYTLGVAGNILRSLDRNNIPTIFRNFKIDAYNADSTAVVFNVTDLFVSHVKELSPFSYLGAYGGSGSPSLSESFKKELSSLDGIVRRQPHGEEHAELHLFGDSPRDEAEDRGQRTADGCHDPDAGAARRRALPPPHHRQPHVGIPHREIPVQRQGTAREGHLPGQPLAAGAFGHGGLETRRAGRARQADRLLHRPGFPREVAARGL